MTRQARQKKSLRGSACVQATAEWLATAVVQHGLLAGAQQATCGPLGPAESHLRHAGIANYPNEVRASRLLSGANLNHQDRQMVLNFCGNKYDTELVANSLQVHYPAWTPGRDVRRGGTPGSSSSSSVFGRGAKGKGKGRGGQWKTFVTGQEQQPDEETEPEEAPDEQDQDDGEETEGQDDHEQEQAEDGPQLTDVADA